MAKAVTAGEITDCPDAQFHKAYMYGLVARSLSGFVMPKPAGVVRGQKLLWVADVTSPLSAKLLAECNRVLGVDRALLEQVDEAVSRRTYRLGEPIQAEPAKRLMGAGVHTGIDAVWTTLATVHARSSQNKMTMPALLQSQRIPFAFAMQHIATLDLNSTELVEHGLVPKPGRSMEGSAMSVNAKIFLPEVVETTHKGLVLATALPDEVIYPDYAPEPRIGCPVTLIKDFIRDMHGVAAQACVQAGVIQVAEG